MKRPPTFPKKIAKLDEAAVRTIRKGLDQGIPAPYYARAYQMSIEQIRKIGRREAWGWVEDSGPEAPTNDELPPNVPEVSKEQVEASLQRLKDLMGPDFVVPETPPKD